MLHFGLFDIRTDIFVLIISIILVLLQVLLCFKVKKTIRLTPVCLTLALTVAFTALGFIFDEWDSFGFFFLAISSAVLLICSMIGWGIWAIVKKIKNCKQ